jgi:hypothetical protein
MLKKIAYVAAILIPLAGCSAAGEDAPEGRITNEELAELELASNAKLSKFSSEAELRVAVDDLLEQFKSPAIREEVLQAFPAASRRFDRFELFTLAQLGETWLDDQLLLSGELLIEKTVDRETPGTDEVEADLGQTQQALASHPPADVQQNQGDVYKTRGQSFAENYLVYLQTGALTQFEKRRKRFWVTSWYDTDASRIGVRAIYFGNPSSYYFPEANGTSFAMAEGHDYNVNDDYVSDRRIGAGGTVTYDIGPGGDGFSPGLNFSVTNYEGVYGLHSVDHAGYQWRLVTSRGLRPNVYWGNYRAEYYVPW